MATKIFVNLPVRDLDASMAFFRALGFGFNPHFTNETAACMVIGEDNYAMLLTRAKFAEFTRKPIVDAAAATEVLIALSQDSRAEVDGMAEAAKAAGATEPSEPRDYGFMYQRSFEDPDGHIWEVFWMDPAVAAGGPPAADEKALATAP